MGEEVVFLREIISGGADKSYGIHVADMAGIPNTVVNRANQILKKLLLKNNDVMLNNIDQEIQTNVFSDNNKKLISEVKKININEMTPLQAFIKLNEIIKKIC